MLKVITQHITRHINIISSIFFSRKDLDLIQCNTLTVTPLNSILAVYCIPSIGQDSLQLRVSKSLHGASGELKLRDTLDGWMLCVTTSARS